MRKKTAIIISAGATVFLGLIASVGAVIWWAICIEVDDQTEMSEVIRVMDSCAAANIDRVSSSVPDS